MMSTTKRELQEENEQLRGKLEEAYDVIGEALGFDDNDGDNSHEDDDGEESDDDED